MKHTYLIFFATLFYWLPIVAQPNSVSLSSLNNDQYFKTAYDEIATMLDGKSALSIKRAVFLTEWAYLDGGLDYKAYCAQIDSTTQALKRFIRANNLQQYKTGGNYALFEYFSRPNAMNGNRPFTYDFDDLCGSDDYTKLFVTKLMRTHSGQCRSLPMYYKVLAEAIGAEAHIAFAPQHLFIRHRDERDTSKWVNVELTTQSFSRELFYIENFGISAEAIRNKIYLYPLSDRETISYLLSELGEGYRRKFNCYDVFMLKCSEKALEYYPHNIMALQNRGNIMTVQLMDYLKRNGNRMDQYACALDNLWLENNAFIRKLGWTEMPDSVYTRLLEGVEDDMKRKNIDSLTRKQVITKIKKADKKL